MDDGQPDLFAASPWPMLVFDLTDHTVLEVNPAAVALYGYPREEFLRLRIEQLRPEEDVEALEEHLAHLRERPEPERVWRHRTRDGRIVHVQAEGADVLYRDRPARLVAIRDVTEAERVKRVLKVRLALETATSELSARFLALEPEEVDGEILHALGTVARLVGAVRASMILGSEDLTRFSIEHEWCAAGAEPQRELLQDVPAERLPWLVGELRAGRTVALDDVARLPSEAARERALLETLAVHSLLLVPLAHGGVVLGALAFDGPPSGHAWAEHEVTFARLASDIVANALVRARADERLREREAQLRRAQKLEAVGRLAGGVAHDVNNLLQAILTAVQRLPPAGEARGALEEVERLVERGGRLTRQLLLLARKDVPAPERLDLGALVGQTGDILQRRLPRQVRVAIAPAERPVWVEGDRTQLEQVVTNLVVNASEAMPDGGTVQLTVDARDESAVVTVADTGCGMEPQVRERMFEPFFTSRAREGHFGLGLAVVEMIVRQHGGSIAVDSSPGEGTRVQLRLPRRLAEAPAPPPAPPSAPALVAKRLLLVEDNDATREGLAQMLELMGWEVTAAASGEEAIAVAGAASFAVLVTDLMLPGIPGTAVAADLRARWPDLAVVVMSGYAENELARRTLDEGGVRFLAKPFGRQRLEAEIEAALAQLR